MRWSCVVALRASLGVVALSCTDATERYIRRLDLEAIEHRGADLVDMYRAPRPTVSELEERRAMLAEVDRPAVLRHVFTEVTRGSVTPLARQVEVTRFLQTLAVHDPVYQPLDAGGQMIMDPLLLIEGGSMRCGHVARLAVDLFAAAGTPGRLVQLGGHVAAEIYYDGAWHLLDADIFGGGEVIMMDGAIPSLAALSQDPFRLDALAAYLERGLHPAQLDSPWRRYPSWDYFAAEAYGKVSPRYYVKTATPEQARRGSYYGWDSYRTEPNTDLVLLDMEPRHLPGPIVFRAVTFDDAGASVSWQATEDKDGDLSGYRVFVSTASRGWDYPTFLGDDGLRRFWAGDGEWRPEMYERLFAVPPSDVALLEVTITEVVLTTPRGQRVYVTVMPLDAHGKRVGKRLYLPSNELVLDLTVQETAPPRPRPTPRTRRAR